MTSRYLLVGLRASAVAVAAAVGVIATNGSDKAVFVLLLSLALLGRVAVMAYGQQQADDWIAQFPGPVAISAPAWQRVLLCLSMLAVAGVLVYAVAFGKDGRGDDWEFPRMVVAGAVGLLIVIGALYQLPRREMVLRLDRLEYRSFRGSHSYRWSDFSRFYLVNRRWPNLMCEFAHQSHRNWLTRRALMIVGPMGASKRALKTLLIAWQARALASESTASSGAMARDTRPRGRSLLDYA